MDWKPVSELSHFVAIVRRALDRSDIRFPASLSFISGQIACEAVQICAPRCSYFSEGHSAFPDQRMALLGAGFQSAENPLQCPSGAKGADFAG